MTYDGDESETSIAWGDLVHTRFYGDIKMEGKEFSDDLCLSDRQEKCLEDFPILAARSVKNMPANIEGVLGLSKGTAEEPSLIMKLFEEELVPEAAFSFYHDGSYNSFIDFGAPQEF